MNILYTIDLVYHVLTISYTRITYLTPNNSYLKFS